jgi:hypothetical protein
MRKLTRREALKVAAASLMVPLPVCKPQRLMPSPEAPCIARQVPRWHTLTVVGGFACPPQCFVGTRNADWLLGYRPGTLLSTRCEWRPEGDGFLVRWVLGESDTWDLQTWEPHCGVRTFTIYKSAIMEPTYHRLVRECQGLSYTIDGKVVFRVGESFSSEMNT